MNMPSRSPRLLHACALIAPAVIVQVCAMVLGTGRAPAPAAAATPSGGSLEAVLAPPRTAEPSPPQQRALEYLRQRPAVGAPIRSPMAHEVAQTPTTPPPPVPPTTPDTGPESVRLPLPELRLTTILGNSRGGLAAMNGRICAPGDEVAPGWRLSSIDAAGDRVVITSTDGQTAEIPLRPTREN